MVESCWGAKLSVPDPHQWMHIQRHAPKEFLEQRPTLEHWARVWQRAGAAGPGGGLCRNYQYLQLRLVKDCKTRAKAFESPHSLRRRWRAGDSGEQEGERVRLPRAEGESLRLRSLDSPSNLRAGFGAVAAAIVSQLPHNWKENELAGGAALHFLDFGTQPGI